ncbi:MAG: DUF2155 domain-containing protein [Rhodobacteraceae bacterium CG17_big_fil_post_rev_8_21_14_2_50_63_15]|nr:DUF2155 domain-containing protein [Roseovarius sp.]PIV78493.1 MAG: DUF2155 domain-containing protein [Rhodobacteraceae bacterium CG17_big_fil_post_rev_8_21_14_2_50_63_15]
MRWLFVGLALCLVSPVAAAQDAAVVGVGAVLRGLDKINGEVRDLDLVNGEEADFGSLVVKLTQCRYPDGDPASDAYAFLTIRGRASNRDLFAGWMLASSPALNALEHPRYDVWVLRCKI